MNRFTSIILATAIAMAMAHSYATAQAPAKKQAKGSNAIMTKAELRACMKLDKSNEIRTDEIEKRHETLSKERDALEKVVDDSAPARAEIEKLLEEVKQADALVAANAAEIEDWNTRNAEYTKKSKEMRNAARRGRVLQQERSKLEAANEELTAVRATKVAVYEKAVEALNKQITERSGGNVAWNQRYDALRAEEAELNKAKDKWAAECGNRRFREDDEIAIKKELAGKKAK